MVKLDDEEQELVESFERGEWRPVAERNVKVEGYRDYAQVTLKKDMRMSRKDFGPLQTWVLEYGNPYQTLIASVLHKYVNGRFVDKTG